MGMSSSRFVNVNTVSILVAAVFVEAHAELWTLGCNILCEYHRWFAVAFVENMLNT